MDAKLGQRALAFRNEIPVTGADTFALGFGKALPFEIGGLELSVCIVHCLGNSCYAVEVELGGWGLVDIAVSTEHAGPGISQHIEVLNDLFDAVALFSHVAAVDAAFKVLIQSVQGLGQIAAAVVIQCTIELANDIARPLQVVIHRHIELGRISELKTSNGTMEEPDGSIVEHQDHLAGRCG